MRPFMIARRLPAAVAVLMSAFTVVTFTQTTFTQE
jgi:hypothetical protein